MIGVSLIATKGYAAPEVGHTYTRARQLCEHLEDSSQLFPVLRGLWNYYLVRAELKTAHELGEQLLALAQQVQDSAMLVAAHRALGVTLYHLGAAASAHTHCAQGSPCTTPSNTVLRHSCMGRTRVWCATALPLGRYGVWAILSGG